MMAESPLHALVSLGFSALEAEVYVALLGDSPATGYRIAQTLGKQAANVYKALEALEKKGAVIVERGARTRIRAVAPDELLSRLQRDFLARRHEAERALAKLPGPADDDRIYNLATREQVFERARVMISRCTRVMIVDTVSRPLEALRPDLEAAAARGVDIAVRTDAPTTLSKVEVLCRAKPKAKLESWPGDWLCVLADGREHLIAFMSAQTGEVHQAVWTGSTYLSWVYYCGAWAELVVETIDQRIRAGADVAGLSAVLRDEMQRRIAPAPGRELLLRRFGATAEPERVERAPIAAVRPAAAHAKRRPHRQR